MVTGEVIIYICMLEITFLIFLVFCEQMVKKLKLKKNIENRLMTLIQQSVIIKLVGFIKSL